MVMQTTRRRFGTALVLAVVLSFTPFVVSQVHVNPCAGYTSSDWQYWLMGCYLMSGAPVSVMVR